MAGKLPAGWSGEAPKGGRRLVSWACGSHVGTSQGRVSEVQVHVACSCSTGSPVCLEQSEHR